MTDAFQALRKQTCFYPCDCQSPHLLLVSLAFNEGFNISMLDADYGSSATAAPHDKPSVPITQKHSADMKTNEFVTIKGFASVEHHQPGGGVHAYEPGAPAPMPVKAGDRLRLKLEVKDNVWIYAIAAFRQSEFWKLGEWRPVAGMGDIRFPWPDGKILTEDDARMTTLFVIASSEELAWAHELTRANCGTLKKAMPPKSPQSACDHLYNLFWKVPGRIRGRVSPKVERFEHDGTRLPAIIATNGDSPFTAVEWLFKSRQ